MGCGAKRALHSSLLQDTNRVERALHIKQAMAIDQINPSRAKIYGGIEQYAFAALRGEIREFLPQ